MVSWIRLGSRGGTLAPMVREPEEAPSPEETTERLFDLLGRLRRLRRGQPGDPALTRLDSRSGRARGHLRRQLKGDIRMSVEELFQTCDLLGADPEEYIAAARQGATPVDLLLGELKRENPREFCELLDARHEEVPANPMSLEDLAELLRELYDLLRSGAPAAREPSPYAAALARLEEFDDDRATYLRSYTWMLLGTTFRQRGAFSAAAHCYRQAMFFSKARSFQRARVLHRVSSLAVPFDPTSSLVVLEEVRGVYLHNLRFAEVGRSLVNSALILSRVAPKKAEDYYEASFQFLSEDKYGRFSALQGSGMTCLNLGRPDLARTRLKMAERTYRCMAPGMRQQASLDWLSGEIAGVEGDFTRALVHFENLRNSDYVRLQPARIAVVNLRLAKISFRLGDWQEIARVNAHTVNLMPSLRRQSEQTAVLAEFHRRVIDRALTSHSLDRLYNELLRTTHAL